MELIKIFQSKKEVLEYLGKDGGDNKLVDRLVANGKFIKQDGMYIETQSVIAAAMVMLQVTQKDVKDTSAELEKLKKELGEANEAYENLNNDYIKIEQENKSMSSTIEELIEKGIIQRWF